MLFLNIYAGLGYLIQTTHINWICKVWVHLINKRQQETDGLLGKKTNSMKETYYGGNERENYNCLNLTQLLDLNLTQLLVALFFNLSFLTAGLLW